MARLDDQLIQDIRMKTDIVDVISQYISVQKKGKSHVAICPFHDDHDPSMSIDSDKQIYKCFVCGAGGNVFRFVQNYEHISFPEAVAKVGERVGIEILIESTQPTANPQSLRSWKVMQMANDFLMYARAQNDFVTEYLASRGIDEKLADYFQIGYNMDGDVLSTYMLAKSCVESEIVECNLANVGANRLVDVFKNRLTIPIHDQRGNIIAYTARILPPNEGAKYINSATHALYNKSEVIFNYHRAKIEAKKTNQIYVVEGAMDVVGLAKAGVYHAVATLGTSVTKQQLLQLKNLHQQIVLFYDGDRAGLSATYRFGMLANEVGLKFTIVKNDKELDPDELFMQFGKDTLLDVLKSTYSWIDFLFDFLTSKYELGTYSDFKAYADEINTQILSLTDEVERNYYWEKLYRKTGFNYAQSKSVKQNSTQKVRKASPTKIKDSLQSEDPAEIQLLSQMMKSRQATNLFIEQLGFFVGARAVLLASYLVEYYRYNEELYIADFLDFVKDEKLSQFILQIDGWALAIPTYSMPLVLDSIIKIKIRILDQKIGECARKVLDNPSYYSELIKLKKERAELIHDR